MLIDQDGVRCFEMRRTPTIDVGGRQVPDFILSV